MSEMFLAVFVVLATVFIIETVHICVCGFLKDDRSFGAAFIVIPLRKDSTDIEMTIRDVLRKASDMKIYVWNIDGGDEELIICRKLLEDFGGFEIVENISSEILFEK